MYFTSSKFEIASKLVSRLSKLAIYTTDYYSNVNVPLSL